MGPESIPASSWIIVTPVVSWPRMMAHSTGAALRRVELCDDGDHVESFPDERGQRGYGEFGGTKERHTHLQLTRRLRRYLLEIPGLSLARLLPFGQQQAALHGAEVTEKQNAV